MKQGFVSKTLLWDFSLLLVAMVWGLGFVVTKNALEVITPLYFLAVRFMIAGGLMVILFYKNLRKASRQELINGCIIGVFLATAFIAQTVGAKYTTPAKSSLLTGLNVVLVPFVLILITRKLPAKKALFSAFTAFAGMALLSVNESFTVSFGDSLTILCAVLYAGHIVTVGYYGEKPIDASGRKADVLVLATVQIVFTGVFCTILALFLEPVPNLSGGGIWGGLLYSGLLSTLAAFLVQNVAQKNTPSTHAAIILCLESVFGTIASAMLWGEVMTGRMIIGCVMIFGAIVINEVDFRAVFQTNNTKRGF